MREKGKQERELWYGMKKLVIICVLPHGGNDDDHLILQYCCLNQPILTKEHAHLHKDKTLHLHTVHIFQTCLKKTFKKLKNQNKNSHR